MKIEIKLPEMHAVEDWGEGTDEFDLWCPSCEGRHCGWNACLDEVKRLNKQAKALPSERELAEFLTSKHNELVSGDGSYPDWDLVAKAILARLGGGD